MALEKFTIWREANEDKTAIPAQDKSALTTTQQTQVGKLARTSMSNLRDLTAMEEFLTEVIKVIMEKTNKDTSVITRVLNKIKSDIQKMGHNI